MSKRDEDPQTDMEAGMTTAERRRRRRRGGGLRVPSDNVPRRPTGSQTPIAPVPEDPSLAMSIAYSFSPEADAPTRESAPTFEQREPTALDPVDNGADFDTKTREMSAVDLEALGIDELGRSAEWRGGDDGAATHLSMPAMPAMPAQRNTVPDFDAHREPNIEVRFSGDATDPAAMAEGEDVDVDIGLDAVSGATLDEPGSDGRGSAAAWQRGVVDHTSDEDEEDSEELSADDALTDDDDGDDAYPATSGAFAAASSGAFAPASATTPSGGVPTAARGDGSQPRAIPSAAPLAPASREQSGPRQIPVMTIGGEPIQVQTQSVEGPQIRPATPSAAISALSAIASSPSAVSSAAMAPAGTAPAPQLAFRQARAQTLALSEEDLEEVREAARLATQPSQPPSTATPPGGQPVSPSTSGQFAIPSAQTASAPQRPTSMSMPPPMPAGKRGEPSSSPEIDIVALEGANDPDGEGSGEIEVDVEGIVDARSAPIPVASGLSGAPTLAPAASLTPTVSSLSALSTTPAFEQRPRTPSQPPSFSGASSSGSLAPRDSQPMAVQRDSHAPPPPPAAKTPPSPPPKKEKPAPAASASSSAAMKADGKPRGKPWFVEIFDEDYLRTLPFLTPQATQAEAEFVINAMGLSPGAQLLDIGCGYGRHAMELAARGFHVVGLDMSTPLLVRGGEEAHRRGLTINFVRGDMRELDFDAQFDGAYCLFSTFGYFDDETNKKTIANIARALRPGGRILIEILNRDYIIADLPTRVWWEGDGCVVLEEVDLNYFSSRVQVNRSVVFDDGRQLEQEISVRAYSLHEVGKLMHAAGFRVLEVSGAYHTRGRFFGNQSRHIIVLAERKDPNAG